MNIHTNEILKANENIVTKKCRLYARSNEKCVMHRNTWNANEVNMKWTKTYTSEYCYLQVKRKQCSGTIEHSINITFLLIQNRRNKDKKFKRNNKRTIVKVFFKKNEHYIFVNYTKKCFHIHKQGLKKHKKCSRTKLKWATNGRYMTRK